MELLDLKKGEVLDLHKENPGLKVARVAFGWVANDGNGNDFDVDGSAFLLNGSGKVYNGAKSIVYYKAKDKLNSVYHSLGDDRTGSKTSNVDCEAINVNFERLDPICERIDFIATIYVNKDTGEGVGLTFRNIKNAYIRVVNDETGKEICRFNLTDDYGSSNSVVAGSFIKKGSNWSFAAIGSGQCDADLNTYFARYQ